MTRWNNQRGKPVLTNKLEFGEHLQSTIYNLQSVELGGLSPADMRGLYHRSRPALSGAGGGKCDSGFAYHRRKPAFSYIVDCKW